jgi:hypothetical protein
MVEDKKNFRTTTNQFNNGRQLVVIEAEVKGEVEICQRADASDEIGLQTEAAIHFALQIPADAFDQRILGECRQGAVYTGSKFNASLGHDTVEPGFVRGKFSNPSDFIRTLGSQTTAFDKNHFANVSGPGREGIILGQKWTIQRGHSRQPRIIQPGWMPEMNVSVNAGIGSMHFLVVGQAGRPNWFE